MAVAARPIKGMACRMGFPFSCASSVQVRSSAGQRHAFLKRPCCKPCLKDHHENSHASTTTLTGTMLWLLEWGAGWLEASSGPHQPLPFCRNCQG